jgi:hypothetical protein
MVGFRHVALHRPDQRGDRNDHPGDKSHLANRIFAGIFDLGQLASRAQTSAGDECMTDHGTFGDRVAGEPSR